MVPHRHDFLYLSGLYRSQCAEDRSVFDEIELLIFESLPASVLPTASEIQKLARLSEEMDVTYNIHLPTDVSLTHPSAMERQHAAETFARVVDLCRPLNPSTHTLHLEMDGHETPEKVSAWQALARDGLATLRHHIPDPGILSVETLDYSPDCLMPLLTSFDLKVCLDVGHHFRHGFDLKHSLDLFRERIALVHLHGVATQENCTRDHVGLDRLPPGQQVQVMKLLEQYQGTMSLEVFNRLDLNRSLTILSRVFEDVPGPLPG